MTPDGAENEGPGQADGVTTVPVPQRLTCPHALVERLRTVSLDAHRPPPGWAYGVPSRPKDRLRPLGVSRDSLPRALRILQGLLNEGERRGCTISESDPTATGIRDVCVVIRGQPFAVTVSEHGDKLRISLPREYSGQRQWNEGPCGRLEHKLEDVLRSLEARAAEIEERRRAREEEERRREETRQRALEDARSRFAEAFRARVLRDQVDSWSMARSIREMCQRIREGGGGEVDPGADEMARLGCRPRGHDRSDAAEARTSRGSPSRRQTIFVPSSQARQTCGVLDPDSPDMHFGGSQIQRRIPDREEMEGMIEELKTKEEFLAAVRRGAPIVITDTGKAARFHPSAQGCDHVTFDGFAEKVLVNGGKNGKYFAVGSRQEAEAVAEPLRMLGLELGGARAMGERTDVHTVTDDTVALGPAWATGHSFRARAEAQQRKYRADRRLGHARWGHILEAGAAEAGKNFLTDVALRSVRAREGMGKGVDHERTFGNMLSSQAMCFNLFGTLDGTPGGRTVLATSLRDLGLPVRDVTCTRIEYTPPAEIFGDQSVRGGADCDVLVKFVSEGDRPGVLVLETKFVEPRFSRCGFRRQPFMRRHPKTGQLEPTDRCPEETSAGADGSGCLYQYKKGYRYWERTRALGTVRPDVLVGPCPFGDDLWQLWTNHTLAHALKPSADALALFAVCAPRGNTRLLGTSEGGAGKVDMFARLLDDSATVSFLPVEDLITELHRHAPPDFRSERCGCPASGPGTS